MASGWVANVFDAHTDRFTVGLSLIMFIRERKRYYAHMEETI